MQMSKQHRLINLSISYQAGPNLELENSSFFLSLSSVENIERSIPEQHSNPSFQSLCKFGEIMYNLTLTFHNVEEADGIYIK